MTKKLLALLVAALMVLTLVPMGALAKSAPEKTSLPAFADRIEHGKKLEGAKRSEEVVTRDDVVCDGSLLNENFDGDSLVGSWSIYNADGNTATLGGVDFSNWMWLGIEAYAHSGENEMVSWSWFGNDSLGEASFNQDNWLILTDVTIPAAGYYLSYYASSLASTETYRDHLQVYVGNANSTSDISTWTSVVANYAVPNEYTQQLVDLSDYAGQTIDILFRHVDYDMVGVALDDVQIGLVGDIVEPTSVELSAATLALGVAESAMLTATVLPEDANVKTVTWSSSDPTVAAVNKMGGVMGLAVGTATITATATNGISASCVVTVSEGDYSFSETMQAYTIYDLDGSASTDNLYTVNQYGTMTLKAAVGADIVVSEFNYADGLLYGYVENADETYSFISVDPETYAVTTINSGLADIPMWLAFDWDADVMYGGFLYEDANEDTHFDIAEVNMATGEEGTIAVDVYNQTYEYEGETYSYEFLPFYATYVGDGMFVGADKYYDRLLLLVPDYNGEGFAAGLASNYALSAMVGTVTNYYQKMWYNPYDGMLYWASIFGTTCYMTLVDLATGIAVNSGITGPAGASYGMETTGLFDIPEEEPTGLLGDVDCDGDVDFDDVTLLNAYLLNAAEVSEQGLINANVNGDSRVSSADVVALSKLILGA